MTQNYSDGHADGARDARRNLVEQGLIVADDKWVRYGIGIPAAVSAPQSTFSDGVEAESRERAADERRAAPKLHAECLRSMGHTPTLGEILAAAERPMRGLDLTGWPTDELHDGAEKELFSADELDRVHGEWVRLAGEEWYYEDGAWTNYNPRGPKPKYTSDWPEYTVTFEPRPCTVKVEGLNPKDERALKRVPLWALPAIGAIHGAQAAGFGLAEYGAYNWREKPIKLMEYLGALERHIACLKDGQWRAEDSKITHLGHINATTAIILDAEQCGTLIDDRPKRQGRSHEELGAYRERQT